MKTVITADLQKWQKVGEARLLAQSNGLRILEQDFVNPKDKNIETFSILTKREGITICPITNDGDLVLVRQYKQGVDNFVLEFPAGNFENGENGKVTALRELREETGYVAQDLIVLSQLSHIMPRKSPSAEYVAIALGCEPVGLQRLDEAEGMIETLEMTQGEFFTLVFSGEITSAPTKLAAFMAMLYGYISLEAVNYEMLYKMDQQTL